MAATWRECFKAWAGKEAPTVVGTPFSTPRPCGHGHGHCARCGEPWCRVESRTIAIDERSGMFPTCRGCYDVSTVEEMETYILRVGGQWATWARTPDEARKCHTDAEAAIVNMRADRRRAVAT